MPLRSAVRLMAAATVLALAGCGTEPAADEPEPAPEATAETATTTESALGTDPVATALRLTPQTAEAVTVTNWDAIRERQGVPDLSSEALMTDRFEFWEAVRTDVVALTEGQLSAENSRFELDAGFTRDDVDWEAHWTGPDGPGWVLAMRPDLKMELVRSAIEQGMLPTEAQTDGQLVLHNVAGNQRQSWAADPTMTALAGWVAEAGAVEGETDVGVGEATYLHQGCLSLRDALGPDADIEDQQDVLRQQDITELEPLAAFAVRVDGEEATALLGPNRADLGERAALGQGWPRTGSIGWQDAFSTEGADREIGSIELPVKNPVAATTAILTGLLPFAVCPEVRPFDEPTGL